VIAYGSNRQRLSSGDTNKCPSGTESRVVLANKRSASGCFTPCQGRFIGNLYPKIYVHIAPHNIQQASGHGMMEATMRSDEYRRLYAACLTMAQQSELPNVQARWLTMAQAWLNRADEMRPKKANKIDCSNVISLSLSRGSQADSAIKRSETSDLSSSFVVY
jgi:hypothetical protein